MSKAPLTPGSRRPRTPNGNDYDVSIPVPSSTRPLQINRPPTRPATPSSSNTASQGSPRMPDYSLPNGPSRPQRSGLRSRQVSEYSEDGGSIDSRSTRDSRIRESTEVPMARVNNVSSSSKAVNGRSRPGKNPTSPTSGDELSPTSSAAIAAFQSVITRRRTNTRDDVMDDEYEKAREREMEVQKVRQKRIRDKMPSRKTGRHKPGDIDAVLDEIKDEWEMVTDPDFNPVDLALQLLDGSSGSSLGKNMDSFRRTKDMLSTALKGSVDKNYQAFAAALPHHSALLNNLSATQAQISEARNALQEAKESLGSKRADLVQLWSRNQTVEEMLRILDQIEHLRTVPDVLESLISEKRLLQASVLLVRSLKVINKQDMLDIGALADLRGYLNSQESALREILIDELHSHLYLRSFWCDARWVVYTPNQHTLPTPEFENDGPENDVGRPSTPTSPTSKRTRLTRYLDELNLRPNDPPYDLSEREYRNSVSGAGISASGSVGMGLSMAGSRNSIQVGSFTSNTSANNSNPEADSFSYIENLLESLAVLGKLGSALDIVTQKLPQEIYTLVETTLDEVGERAEYGRRGSLISSIAPTIGSSRMDDVYFLLTSGGSTTLGSGVISVGSTEQSRSSGLLPAASLRLTALEASTKRLDQETMKDLFWTLYSKLDAVAQGCRVVYEVSNRIGSRRNFKDSTGAKPGSLFPLAEIWAPVQAEIRTLLNDYITDEEQGAVSGRNPISSINEVLREGKYNRERLKPAFRFADTDMKQTSKALKEYEDGLAKALRETVPGLVQGSLEGVQATLSAVGTDDRLLGTGHHHRTLVHPDAFHVSLLFQPTLAFLDRIVEILPFGQEASRDSTVLLEEFVLKVYLPQLEDKVSLFFHQAVSGMDAFQPDPSSSQLSQRPLIKASIQLMALINSLCGMLRATPFHRESYARMILTVIVQFYQRCSDKFQDLVSLRNVLDPEAPPRIALAAQWAQQAEIIPCLTEMLSLSRKTESCSVEHLHKQETHLELNLIGDRSVTREELVASTRDLANLASLYHSVTWFTSQLNELKSVPEGILSPTTPKRLEPVSAITPYTPYIPLAATLTPEELRLPLSSAMALRFQALLKTYEQLSEAILHTIHVDVRCRVMHHLNLALQSGNYRIEQEATEPDPHITDLNIELSKCDEIVLRTLPAEERRFVFEGIGQLMESLLISNARYIRRTNEMGILKMTRNILALQQNVKTIAIEKRLTPFDRAKRFYSLFNMSTSELLDTIRQKQEFTFEEYKTIIDLQCGVDPTVGENAAAQATDRNYNMYLIELHGLELENSADDSSP
ncbi:Sec8 exocyst complex component-specific domain-containing protein [Cristinia sonorae]|uniref:Exocyst complex component Sec8 n=1 Tax=Cristinia sonorae TaxID=1940300 RepID=A0A8K0UMI6_9AGAR|nr:Sec8 exocyst complex component-specific domain-containing protein [Cristinia sonorae]